MDPVRFAFEPLNRERPEYDEAEEPAASHSGVPSRAISWLILAALLVLIPIMILGNTSGRNSSTDYPGRGAGLAPFASETSELDERIPRGWQ
jgi:hypothetical protein